jgi:hypothetical protein
VREYGPGRPLVFNHIPKCAGTSLRTALIDALRPDDAVYRFDLSLVGGYRDFGTLDDATRATFVLSPEELPADADFVTGHISPGTTRARYAGADHITTLRHPGLRLISQWVHSRSLSDFDLRHFGGRDAAAFRVARLPLAKYLQHEKIAPNIDNTITRFLAWPHPLVGSDSFIAESDDAEVLAAALRSVDAMAHVGLVEDAGFMDRLSEWFGRPLVEKRLNERVSVPRKRRPDLATELDGETTALLAHRMRLDDAVWRHVAAKQLPDADPDAVLAAHWDKAVDRYAVALKAPVQSRPVRRTAEVLYGLGTSLRRRGSDEP